MQGAGTATDGLTHLKGRVRLMGIHQKLTDIEQAHNTSYLRGLRMKRRHWADASCGFSGGAATVDTSSRLAVPRESGHFLFGRPCLSMR